MPLIGANGGLLGSQRSTSASTAPGLWTPNEQVVSKRAGVWPLSGDPYFGYNSLLLHMDGSNGSTTFTDSSVNGLTVTANGDAKISTAQSRFGGASGFFDGNGDYLTVADNDLLELGGFEFTLECWIYVTNLKGYQAIATKSYAAADQYGWGLIFETSNSIAFYAGNGGWSIAMNGGAIISVNTWYHIAVTRSGNVWRLFVNGVQVATTTVAITLSGGTLPLYIGRYPYFPGFNSAQDFAGYIEEFRLTKGVARYTSNFTPPTGPFLDVGTGGDLFYPSTSLLLHMDGSNGSTTFTDNSSSPLSVTANGNAQISTAQSKFGGASGYFDGTGDYLAVAYSTALNFGTGDFTVEMWIRPADLNYRFMIGTTANSNGYLMLAINPTGSGQIWMGRASVNWPLQFSGHSLLINTWAHLAITRSGSSNRLFIDGVQTGSTITDSTNWAVDPNGMYVGINSSNQGWNGYIDDLRITKGVARYTSNFTPSTTAFPNA